MTDTPTAEERRHGFTRTKSVPVAATRFGIGEFEFGDNGEGAKTAPVRMVARTGKPIEHWYWGRVVHDLSGMHLHKARLPIDYCHDYAEVIGYLNKFDADSGDLVCSGALVPYKDSDRASEIVFKARAGVPWEASIDFGGDGIKIEELGEDQSAEVNGYEFEGPGVIIREWPLRGVAVVPYGADMNTSSEFAAGGKDRTIPVTFVNGKEPDMSQEQPAEPKEGVEAEDQPKPDAEGTPEAPAKPDAVEGAEAPAEPTGGVEADEPTPRQECKRFIDAFGDAGGRWFAEGKTFAEAQQLHAAGLEKQLSQARAENEDLRKRLAAGRGEEEPVDFRAVDDSPQAKRFGELRTKVGENVARVAAGLKFANRQDSKE